MTQDLDPAGRRTVAKLIRHADIAAGDGKPIGYQHIKAAAELLWGAGR